MYNSYCKLIINKYNNNVTTMVFSVPSVHEVTFGELNICDIIINIILSINLSLYVHRNYVFLLLLVLNTTGAQFAPG